MNTTLNVTHIPSRVLSYPVHRRPPLKRTHASHNLFPDLPPIQTACTPHSEIDVVALVDDGNNTLGGGPCDSGDQSIEVGLSPRCPASPPSPISSSSESSTSSLATPLEADDWERFHDGFAPPPNSPRPHVHPWPPTPNPNIPPEYPPQACDSYHGWSGNSLFEMKRFWYRRHRVWWDYDEHCRHLHNYLAAASTSASDPEGTLDATTYYPPSPALLPSRLTPWSGPNGTLFETERRLATDAPAQLPRGAPRLQVHPPWAPVFPRFGDIEDLRDPSCEHLDRMFMNFPPYAISKLLYVEQMAAAHAHALDSARASQHTLLERSPPPPPPPSPSASSASPSDAPWSPGSVYSQDGRGLAEASTTAASGSSTTPLPPSRASGLRLRLYGYDGALRWSDRWELLRRRLFPQSQSQSLSPSSTTSTSPTSPASPTSPLLLSPSESDPALSSPPVHLPPRPGTPLPDDDDDDDAHEQNNRAAAAFRVHVHAHLANIDNAHPHSDRARARARAREPGESAARDGPSPLGAGAEPGSGPPDSNGNGDGDGDGDGGPVVRLPSSSPHPRRAHAADTSDHDHDHDHDRDRDRDRDRDARAPPPRRARARARARAQRTLADELGAAAGVRFSVAPPVRGSARWFSFLAEPGALALDGGCELGFGFGFGFGEIAPGFDVEGEVDGDAGLASAGMGEAGTY